jgi:hypothetical protein
LHSVGGLKAIKYEIFFVNWEEYFGHPDLQFAGRTSISRPFNKETGNDLVFPVVMAMEVMALDKHGNLLPRVPLVAPPMPRPLTAEPCPSLLSVTVNT